jgi:hypothetical protein
MLPEYNPKTGAVKQSVRYDYPNGLTPRGSYVVGVLAAVYVLPVRKPARRPTR